MSPTTPMDSLVDLLDEMQTLIERLDDVDYAIPAPGRTSGGIGGHVRHCLDHVNAILTATYSGVCAYDRRARGTDIETSRAAAIRAIAELTRLVGRLDPGLLERAVDVEVQLDRSGRMTTMRSSFGRELAFVINHTIHHNAIVAQMLRARGVTTDGQFGLAPSTPSECSTPSERETFACAR